MLYNNLAKPKECKRKEQMPMNKNTATEGFDFSQYIVLQPRQGRADSRRIYIGQDNELHLNGKFMNSIDLEKTHYVKVLLHPKENKIALQLLAEKTLGAAYLATNGRIRLQDIVGQLKGRGIKVPACFEVEKHSQKDIWETTYDPAYRFPEYGPTEKRGQKPRKNMGKEMLPENE